MLTEKDKTEAKWVLLAFGVILLWPIWYPVDRVRAWRRRRSAANAVTP